MTQNILNISFSKSFFLIKLSKVGFLTEIWCRTYDSHGTKRVYFSNLGHQSRTKSDFTDRRIIHRKLLLPRGNARLFQDHFQAGRSVDDRPAQNINLSNPEWRGGGERAYQLCRYFDSQGWGGGVDLSWINAGW